MSRPKKQREREEKEAISEEVYFLVKAVSMLMVCSSQLTQDVDMGWGHCHIGYCDRCAFRRNGKGLSFSSLSNIADTSSEDVKVLYLGMCCYGTANL